MASTKKPAAAKKVEAPIDKRETFVSLQKNFADSEISVEEKLKTLYELQAADSEIDKIIQLRGELPAEVAALEEEIANLKERSAAISAVVDQFNRNIADAKLSIAEHESIIEKYQRQLESIQNSREYDSLNKEIENQDLLRQIDEKTSPPRSRNWTPSWSPPQRRKPSCRPAAKSAPPRSTPAP